MSTQAALKQIEERTAVPAEAKPKLNVQRVAIGRDELSLFVQKGRPTGTLFTAIANLKGLTAAVIAERSGVAPSVVHAVLQDGAQPDFKVSSIQAVAQALGIDLAVMRMVDSQVHIFDLTRSGGVKGSSGFDLHRRAAGLMMRDSLIAKIDPKEAPPSLRNRFHEYHAAQVGESRAIFVTSRLPFVGKPFDAAMVPSAKWVRGTQVKSIVDVAGDELSSLLVLRDLNRVEFDQLFKGQDTVSWDDIKKLLRESNMTRSDLAALMKGHVNGTSPRRRGRGERRAALRLVESSATDV